MKYYKKEYGNAAITAVSFTESTYSQVIDRTSNVEVVNAIGNYTWCNDHYSTKRGWVEIEKGEFLLIKSQAIDKL